MTSEKLLQQAISRLKLPPQDVANLGFCANNRVSAVKAWAEALPATQVDRSSIQLYRALPAIARFKTSVDNRLEMLEAVRPYVQHCNQGLARQFLNQPLILPEAPLKSAVVAQALQKHMTAGYLAVVAELAGRSRKARDKEADKLALGCQRAITGLGLMLLRSFQLYSKTPANLWRELHSLYQIAELCELKGVAVDDALLRYSRRSTPLHAYVRILLLACARPSQMRQTDVLATYEVLEDWARLASIEAYDPDKLDNLFLIKLSADLAPVYKARFGGEERGDLRELDTSPLLNALRQRRTQRSNHGSSIEIPHTLSSSLLDHLEQAWGANQERSFERRSAQDVIEVCIGLSGYHHHSIGGIELAEFLEREEDEASDPAALAANWASGPGRSTVEEAPIHAVRLVNTGPGGHCLEWSERIPAQVRAGEVLGLREKGRHRWALGVIRWIQQRDRSTRLGIQLLAPKTTPYGAAIEQATGEYSDYRRALMLPELKAANQPATLLTAFAPFRENDRLLLNRYGECSQIQLTRRVFSTGSIGQFTFRRLESGPDEAESEGWDN